MMLDLKVSIKNAVVIGGTKGGWHDYLRFR